MRRSSSSPTSTSKVSSISLPTSRDSLTISAPDFLNPLVAHKARQFEDWLADTLENFRRHQEGLISRMPRIVRNVTMRQFAKYNGDIQACLKGVQKERLGGEAEAIDKTTRKRKWVESQEAEAKTADASDAEPLKATKSSKHTSSQLSSTYVNSLFYSAYHSGDTEEKSWYINHAGYFAACSTPCHEDARHCKRVYFICL